MAGGIALSAKFDVSIAEPLDSKLESVSTFSELASTEFPYKGMQKLVEDEGDNGIIYHLGTDLTTWSTSTDEDALKQGTNTLTEDLELVRDSGTSSLGFGGKVNLDIDTSDFLVTSTNYSNNNISYFRLNQSLTEGDFGAVDSLGNASSLKVSSFSGITIEEEMLGKGIKFNNRAVDEANVDFSTDDNNLLSIGKAKENLAEKATLIQNGGNVTGSIDTDANTFSLTSSGGGTVNNTFVQGTAEGTPFGYPYASMYSDDMQGVSTSLTSFNGGIVTYTQGNDFTEVTNAALGRGCFLGFTNELNTEYILRFVVETAIVGAEINVYSQWSDKIGTFNGSGEYFLSYTSQGTNGGFGNKVIITSNNTDNSSFKIFAVAIAVPLTNAIIPTLDDVETETLDILNKDSFLVYYNNFDKSNALDNIAASNGAVTQNLDLENKLVSVSMENARLLGYGYNVYESKDYVKVSFKITNLVGELTIYPRYNSDQQIKVTSNGEYEFLLRNDNGVETSSYNVLTIGNISGSTASFDLHNIVVHTMDNILTYEQTKQWVNLGLNAENTHTPPSGSLYEKGVAIGYNAISNIRGITLVGSRAKGIYNGFFGAAEGNEAVAVGEDSMTLGWRANAFGAKSFAGGQSSTALGCSSAAYSTHETVLGRGATGNWDNKNKVNAGTVLAEEVLTLNNGHSHYMNTPPHGISIGGSATPKIPQDIEVGIIGQSAYDGRFPLYNVGTSYVLKDKVREGDTIYNCIQASTGNSPSTSPTFFETLILNDGSVWEVPNTEGSQGDTPSENSVDGGHIYLQSGYGTGGQDGGEVRFYSTPATGFEGDNVQSQKTLEAKFTSDSSVVDGSRFWLLDASDNTLKRVRFGDDDSAGVGFKILKVQN